MSSILLTIIGLAVSIIGIAARIYFFSSGRNKEKLKNAENELEAIDEGKDIENDIASMPDGAALDELHDEWAKK